MAILTDLKDPRVQDVTVTFVEVSPDLRQAKVYVSVMGDETKQRLSLKGLQAAAGYLQKKVNNRVEMRYTPRIEFKLDQGVKHSLEVARILHELLPPQNDAASDGEDRSEPAASAASAPLDAPPSFDFPHEKNDDSDARAAAALKPPDADG